MLRSIVQSYRYHRDMRHAHRFVATTPHAALLKAAVTRSVSDPVFARIENRRAELLADDTPVTVIDYGASNAGTTVLRKSAITRASKPKQWARMLYSIVRDIQPARVLEMGTCVGISGSYIAAAMPNGRLLTLEGNPATADIARETFASIGLGNVSVVTGPFAKTLGHALEQTRPVDMVFVDGHHDGDATVAYFKQIRPFLSPNAVLIFDDIRWSQGMTRAWTEISNEFQSLDLGSIGIIAV